ncbi:MAG: phytase [Rhodospirillaceae bacterium]|nr:phytase [Rhodospirillaceae bacterium]
MISRSHLKIVGSICVVAAIGAVAVVKFMDHKPVAELPFPPGTPTVFAAAETPPVANADDAADDPAIWVNPQDPSKSVVIGTSKKEGLYVYDLGAKTLQFVPNGRMNNVDLRDKFMLGGREMVLVTASDRTNKAIAILTLDPDTRQLSDVADGLQSTGDLSDPYGLCMYRKDGSEDVYVFVNDPLGHMKQWKLVATPTGKVRAELVRTFSFSSQVEGCVADDQSGALYVAEEGVAVWKMGADPSAGDTRASIAAIKDITALHADLEGISIWAGPEGTGYLVLSSQGNNTYAVFERAGSNKYIGSFAIDAGTTGIDGVSETDGLDVTSTPLPGFPQGLLVVQDGHNVNPVEHQNFKYVSWQDVAAKLRLP